MLKNTTRMLGFALVCTLLSLSFTVAASKPDKAAIASAHPLATQAGHEILSKGGNAFDAAIAVSATLAVVEPYASGLGGGGFYLLYDVRSKKSVMVDARETAPSRSSRTMYLDSKGEVVTKASLNGPLASGIPGIPAALVHLSRKYGKLPLEISLAPAIRIARQGFKIDKAYVKYAGLRETCLNDNDEAARIFLQDGDIPEIAHVLKQPDLADTLELLGMKGFDGFYRGTIANRLVKAVSASGGIWTLEDLKNYRVKERQPISISYRGFRITSASPPSSGGVALATMLNILSAYQLDKLDKATRVHIVVEAMRRAYHDRAIYLGDPDFIGIPVNNLISQRHANRLRSSIKPDKATPSNFLSKVQSPTGNGVDTSHFSILDRDGNRVAATLSINYPFGACFVAPGTGVLLNDEMDDFSVKPGVANAYGLVGAEANAIQAGKRPLSSMSPTFIQGENRIAIVGTPGGSRIITMVLLAILEFTKGASAQEMVDAHRFHHQYLPDQIFYESGAFAKNEIETLVKKGHKLKELSSPYGEQVSSYGNMQVVIWDTRKNRVSAYSDRRGVGAALVK